MNFTPLAFQRPREQPSRDRIKWQCRCRHAIVAEKRFPVRIDHGPDDRITLRHGEAHGRKRVVQFRRCCTLPAFEPDHLKFACGRLDQAAQGDLRAPSLPVVHVVILGVTGVYTHDMVIEKLESPGLAVVAGRRPAGQVHDISGQVHSCIGSDRCIRHVALSPDYLSRLALFKPAVIRPAPTLKMLPVGAHFKQAVFRDFRFWHLPPSVLKCNWKVRGVWNW